MKRKSLTLLLAVIVGLGSLHVASRYWVGQTDVLIDPVDIQSPSMLATKLDALGRHQGPRVVLLGDSLIYGAALELHGNANWREDNLSGELQERLLERGHSDVLVLNLGINGGRPADIRELLRLLMPYDVDLVIFDVSPRGFSRDFSEADLLGRPWLRQVSQTESDRWRLRSPHSSTYDRLSVKLRSLAMNVFAPYMLRDTWHWRFLDGTPATVVDTVVNQLNTRLKENASASFNNEMMVLLDIKQRLGTVDFAKENPQRRALAEALDSLSSAKVPALVFYATENPRDLPLIMSPERHREFQQSLQELFDSYAESDVTYVPPLTSLPPERFLDFIHVDAEGYRLLVDYLLPEIEARLG